MRIDAAVATKLERWFPALDLELVEIKTTGPVCWFVAAVLRQGALTFKPFVFFGRHTYDQGSLNSVALLAHELKHIEQYQQFGHFGFLRRYYWDMVHNGFRYRRDLPLEAIAYALQDEVKRELRGDFA